MAFLEDNADFSAAQIATIGLSTSSVVGGEIAGGGYAPLAPTFGAAVAGTASLSAVLQFNGPANAGPVTHLIYRNASSAVIAIRPVTSASFNSDGRLDVSMVTVTAAFTA